MVDIAKVVMYGLLILLFVVVIFSVANYYKSTKEGAIYNSADYLKAISAQDPLDKCKTPPGYTDEKWREHMGHHPDQYKECLG